jgi:hypothetical protein
MFGGSDRSIGLNVIKLSTAVDSFGVASAVIQRHEPTRSRSAATPARYIIVGESCAVAVIRLLLRSRGVGAPASAVSGGRPVPRFGHAAPPNGCMAASTSFKSTRTRRLPLR